MLAGMSQSKGCNKVLSDLLDKQRDLVTRTQALRAGMTEAELRHKLRPGGRWKIVLPGIYLSHDGFLTAPQREVAAILYGGPESVITGRAAAVRHGVRAPISGMVDVLVPHTDRRQSRDFVRVIRTRRMPNPPWVVDSMRWAPPARAVADAARNMVELREVTHLVADAVQRNKCSIGQLSEELRAGPARGSAALRFVLAAVADGVASAAEADFRELVKGSGLPEPLYNPSLYVGEDFLAKPDAWWPEAEVAVEIDSREWHLKPADWHLTTARHDRMTARGILVLHFPPSRIKADPAGIVRELRSALQTRQGHVPRAIRTVPQC